MIRQLFTPAGIVEKELTPDEILELAEQGDLECRIEVYNKKYHDSQSVEKRVEVIAEFLRLVKI